MGLLAVIGLFWLGSGVAFAVLCVWDWWQDRRTQGPQWGCDCCQDEAEEIAVLEAIWEAS